MRRTLLVSLTLLALPLAAGLGLPAAASASALTRVENAYSQNGTVPPCRFSSAFLSAALRQAGPDEAEYFQDLINAISSALQIQASQRCIHGRPAHPVVQIGALGSGADARRAGVQRVGPLTQSTGSGVPAPIVLMLVIALLIALAAAIIGLVRWLGWDPAWAATWRQACGEAGARMTSAWTDLADRSDHRRRHS
jgi:hypothetical protein